MVLVKRTRIEESDGSVVMHLVVRAESAAEAIAAVHSLDMLAAGMDASEALAGLASED